MPEEIVFLSFSSIAAVTFLGYSLMRTISKHLERKHESGGGDTQVLRAEIEEMRARFQGMDEIREQLTDLEERIDFNERVLAQHRDRQALPGKD